MSIDLETYSDVNITKCGAYKYAESEEFEILLFGVSVDGGPVMVYDLACGDTIPEKILAALSDENVTMKCYNKQAFIRQEIEHILLVQFLCGI